MKKVIILICSLLIVFSLSACNTTNNDISNNPDNSSDTEKSIAGEIYVGEWKANVVSSLMDGVTTYKTATIVLNKDGIGTYKGRDLVWEYSEEQNTIKFTISKENISSAFEIQEENGKIVLKYYEDTYYRSADFIAKESE